VLDQKLIRENPTSIEESLSLRGKVFNISQIQELTLQKKEIDIEPISTTIDLHKDILETSVMKDGSYDIRWLENKLLNNN